MRRQLYILTLIVGLIFTVSASGGGVGQDQKLPGAKGPLYEIVGGADFKILGVDVGLNMNDVKPEAPPAHRVFPSGTKELHLAVKFARRPAASSFSIEIYTLKGKVTLGPSISMVAENRTTGEFTVGTDLNPETGAFADGPYQAKVKLDDKVVVVVNWEVGSLNP